MNIVYSDQENLISLKNKSKNHKDEPGSPDYIEQFYSPLYYAENQIFKVFSNNNGAFFVRVSVYVADQFCGELTVFRRKTEIKSLEYIFSPAFDIKNHLACSASGFQLEIGDVTNIDFMTRKIPFASEKTHGVFQQNISNRSNNKLRIVSCEEKIPLMPHFDAGKNAVVQRINDLSYHLIDTYDAVCNIMVYEDN